MDVLKMSFFSSEQPGKQNENEMGRGNLLQIQLSKYPQKE
jgi:hypothetical protein